MKFNRYFNTAVALIICSSALATDSTKVKPSAPAADITVPSGFSVKTFADNIGRARHIAVNTNGDVYVKLERLRNGSGIFRLRDKNGDGVADDSMRFGNFVGTGVAISNGFLYASSNDDVYRYRINANNEVDTASRETIIKGLINKRQHESKSIALDGKGNIYVNIGAPSNSCQIQDRGKGSPGKDPCPILDSAAGIWQFKADKLNQTYGDGERYITGTRNIVGLDWNTNVNELFVMQHGRDQLTMFPENFDDAKNAELPAEEFMMAKKGSNFGWPYCYFDPEQNKRVLAPEYGGDGKKTERCDAFEKPVMAFPAHWAPNALLFYTGSQFPAKYRNGAFIAFHGSWNRAPLKQGGYFVAFVPFKDGKPSGKWEVFAENFAGKEVFNPRDAKHRPCGLAQDKNGALYVSDDVLGTIWKIEYAAN